MILMSELIRTGQRALVSSEPTTKKVVGKSMAVAGGTGLGLVALAAVLPFGIMFYALALLLIGGILYVK